MRILSSQKCTAAAAAAAAEAPRSSEALSSLLGVLARWHTLPVYFSSKVLFFPVKWLSSFPEDLMHFYRHLENTNRS